MTPHKIQLNNAFHKGILIENWKKLIKIGGNRILDENLIYYRQNYYSIFSQRSISGLKQRIYYKHSKRLIRQDQVGELSYRGFEILKFEGLLDKRYLIGDKVL